MYGIERKSEIINILESEGKVEVSSLAEKFGASKETVRRDLHELEKEGVLKRTHGGAVLGNMSSHISEYPVAIREIQRYGEKREICERAASYVEDGDVIFIDNSSTTRYLAEYLPKNKRITVLTNSINLLFEASKRETDNHTYICMGGIFKSTNLSLYGNITINNAKDYYPNKAFISCAGINLEDDVITDGSVHEVDTKKIMIRRSKKVFVLADYTKWGKNGQVFLTKTDDVSNIITDSKAQRGGFEGKNIKVDFV